jgi:hypothetical protein
MAFSPTNALKLRNSLLSLFIAGFLSVLVFHQGFLTLWHLWGMTPNPPFPTRLTAPLNVPQIWSLAFWGGVWGLLLGFVVNKWPTGAKYWIGAFLFGALAPTLFGRFVLQPLRSGGPINFDSLLTLWRGFLINGVWGLGAAVFLRWRP